MVGTSKLELGWRPYFGNDRGYGHGESLVSSDAVSSGWYPVTSLIMQVEAMPVNHSGRYQLCQSNCEPNRTCSCYKDVVLSKDLVPYIHPHKYQVCNHYRQDEHPCKNWRWTKMIVAELNSAQFEPIDRIALSWEGLLPLIAFFAVAERSLLPSFHHYWQHACAITSPRMFIDEKSHNQRDGT